MQSLIALRVIEAARAGYRTFITGMALGADMLFADSVLDHADANPELGIRLVGVSPFAGEERRLSPEELARYNSVKDRCHRFHYPVVRLLQRLLCRQKQVSWSSIPRCS